eukprot:gene17015-biopygen17302
MGNDVEYPGLSPTGKPALRMCGPSADAIKLMVAPTNSERPRAFCGRPARAGSACPAAAPQTMQCVPQITDSVRGTIPRSPSLLVLPLLLPRCCCPAAAAPLLLPAAAAPLLLPRCCCPAAAVQLLAQM